MFSKKSILALMSLTTLMCSNMSVLAEVTGNTGKTDVNLTLTEPGAGEGSYSLEHVPTEFNLTTELKIEGQYTVDVEGLDEDNEAYIGIKNINSTNKWQVKAGAKLASITDSIGTELDIEELGVELTSYTLNDNEIKATGASEVIFSYEDKLGETGELTKDITKMQIGLKDLDVKLSQGNIVKFIIDYTMTAEPEVK